MALVREQRCTGYIKMVQLRSFKKFKRGMVGALGCNMSVILNSLPDGDGVAICATSSIMYNE